MIRTAAEGAGRLRQFQLDGAIALMIHFQRVGQTLFPDNPEAATAVGNTLFIALSNGKIVASDDQVEQLIVAYGVKGAPCRAAQEEPVPF